MRTLIKTTLFILAFIYCHNDSIVNDKEKLFKLYTILSNGCLDDEDKYSLVIIIATTLWKYRVIMVVHAIK